MEKELFHSLMEDAEKWLLYYHISNNFPCRGKSDYKNVIEPNTLAPYRFHPSLLKKFLIQNRYVYQEL